MNRFGISKIRSRWKSTRYPDISERTKKAVVTQIKTLRADKCQTHKLRRKHEQLIKPQVTELSNYLTKWLNGDIVYAPYVLLGWRHFTGYRNPWQCKTLGVWKDYVVEQIKYEAWKNRWHCGYQEDRECYAVPMVWYCDSDVGQLSFHQKPKDAWVERSILVSKEIKYDQGKGVDFWDEYEFAVKKELYFPRYSGKWDGQRNIVAERLAQYYGVELKQFDFEIWVDALKKCGAEVNYEPSYYDSDNPMED